MGAELGRAVRRAKTGGRIRWLAPLDTMLCCILLAACGPGAPAHPHPVSPAASYLFSGTVRNETGVFFLQWKVTAGRLSGTVSAVYVLRGSPGIQKLALPFVGTLKGDRVALAFTKPTCAGSDCSAVGLLAPSSLTLSTPYGKVLLRASTRSAYARAVARLVSTLG